MDRGRDDRLRRIDAAGLTVQRFKLQRFDQRGHLTMAWPLGRRNETNADPGELQ